MRSEELFAACVLNVAANICFSLLVLKILSLANGKLRMKLKLFRPQFMYFVIPLFLNLEILRISP